MTRISSLSRDSSISGDDSEEARVQKLAKHMLKSSLFIGTFMEKRFVESLNAYRDVIKIDDNETDLIENLKVVRKRCYNFYLKRVWIGITLPTTVGAPAGYNLWVTLNEEVFGSYWYKVRNIEFLPNEVRVKLDIVRPVQEKSPVHNISSQQVLQNLSQGDLKELSNNFQNFGKEILNKVFLETLTWTNIKNTTVFMFLLVSTLLTFLVHAIHYLLDYSLKLMNEVSNLIKACTPIILGFIRLVMNTVNGFYTLIAIMWRYRSTEKYHQNIYQIPQIPNYNMRALPYPTSDFAQKQWRNRSSVKIEPLD